MYLYSVWLYVDLFEPLFSSVLCDLCGRLESLIYKRLHLIRLQMIPYLKILSLTQLRLIVLRWLLKQAQRCQPPSSACFSPTVDYLLPLRYRTHQAAVVPSRQQNFLAVRSTRSRLSRFRAFMSAVALGVGRVGQVINFRHTPHS